METLLSPGDCCTPCQTPVSTSVPGPAGAAGAAGTNGANGKNAYTTTTAGFTMPAISNDVIVNVVDTSWMVLGQNIFIGTAGYMVVVNVVSATQVDVANPGFLGNAAGGTPIAGSQGVTPGGLQGPTGPSGVGSLNAISPTTTKGDLIVDNGANSPAASDVRLGVGTNGKVLTAKSSQATGLEWDPIDLTGAATSLSGQLGIGSGGTGQATEQAALDALMPATPATGDLVKYNGTHWVRVPRGTALQILRTNSGGTDIEWGGVPGGVLQMVDTSTATHTANTNVTIPNDDTIPQIGEGGQILTLNITPTTVTSRIVLEALVPVTNGASDGLIAALFNGSSNALAAIGLWGDSGKTVQMKISTEFVPGALTPLTLSLRMGSFQSATTWEVNGASGSRFYGGAQKAWLRATEYGP